RDGAGEGRLLRRGLVDREGVRPEDVTRARARRADIALDEVRPRDGAEDLVVHSGASTVVDLRDDEGRRRAAEPGEAIVAEEEEALRDVPPARHGEVPGQVEVAPADARRRQRREESLHVRTPRLGGRVGGGGTLAVRKEDGV